MNKWALFLLSTIFLTNVCAYKILVAFPYPGKSHTILGEGYVRHLLKAGHEGRFREFKVWNIHKPEQHIMMFPKAQLVPINFYYKVTYITPVPFKNHPNLRQVDVSSNIASFELAKALDFEKMITKKVDLTDMSVMYEMMVTVANRSITHKNVQKFLMDTNEQYDLVIAEWLYHNLYSGFAPIFNCPYVWSSSIEPHPMILSLIDEIGNPAYFPDHMSITSSPLTFSERVSELWHIFYLYKIKWSFQDVEEKAFRDAFGPAAAKRGITLPTLEEVKYNSSMVLGNSHISSGEAQRLPINYIPIAGYHIEDDVPSLPENLQKIMDNAPNGVIYFSMGSMMKSKTMPMELKRDFLNIFSGIKQTVIWKLEEELSDVPKNVHILQWAPQPSILAHPNCKLFVTHGGLLSTTETLHYGVPIIGIPLFADQFINVMRAVRKGYGLQVELGYDTPAKLKVAIEEILGNPKYNAKVKELSFIYHHRPAKPGAELVHWIEHVIMTRGAPHLRSPALHVPIYQKLFLDLIGLVLLGLFVVVRMASKLIGSGKTIDSKKKKS